MNASTAARTRYNSARANLSHACRFATDKAHVEAVFDEFSAAKAELAARDELDVLDSCRALEDAAKLKINGNADTFAKLARLETIDGELSHMAEMGSHRYWVADKLTAEKLTLRAELDRELEAGVPVAGA